MVTLTARRFDADELFATVAAARPRTVSIVGDAFARPMMHALDRRAAAGHRFDTSSLVTITSAGVAWSAEVKRAILEHIPQVTLVDACGSSEGALIGSMVSRRGMALSTDRFLPAPGLRILRADGTDIGAGVGAEAALGLGGRRRSAQAGVGAGQVEIGMFCVPTVARGYRNDPERTEAAFRTLGGRRYVCTGDWGR